MSQPSYVREVAQLPRPSDSQVESFVDYVFSAHSWYKHLPLLPPGTPFSAYLNPNAGREWVRTAHGGHFVDRTADTPESERFHYTWQPTARYVESYGHLDYYTDRGTSFLVTREEGVLDTRRTPQVQLHDGSWCQVPTQIWEAGTTRLTGVIHDLGQQPEIWLARLGKLEMLAWTKDMTLPDVTPADELLAAIVHALRDIPDITEDGATSGETVWVRLRHLGRRVVGAATGQDDGEERGWTALQSPALDAFRNEWMPAVVARERRRFTRAIYRMLEETDASVRGSTA